MKLATHATRGAMTVLIAGGGTGGHLYPGVAVARELMQRLPASRVTFVGTARGIEARVVPQEGFELDVIRSAGLKGKSIAAVARGAALLPLSLIDAWRVISRRKPDLVLGVGGYSSGPVVLLASLRGIPTMVLEQNAMPGLTNRLLARRVRAAAVAYQETLDYFRGRGFVAGNPVRPEFLVHVADSGARTSAPLRVLTLGGSQGARAINTVVVAAAPELARRFPGLEMVHQTGARDADQIRAAYDAAGLRVRVEPFLDRMADEMIAASAVISRAGATTLAELAAIGRPAVLIPFPGATDNHQRKNAEVLAKAGAAELIDERDLTPDGLADRVAEILADSQRISSMAAAMRGFARLDAAARVVDRALELVA